MKINSGDIELAITRDIYSPRQHLLFTNVSWGLGLHECDLLVLSGAGYLTEIEIKISVSDCRRDIHKRHHHDSQKIKYLYFAVPSTILEKCLPLIPERAGIIEVRERRDGWYYATTHRRARARAGARPLTEYEITKLMRLGCIRYWCIREHLENLKRQLRNETERRRKLESGIDRDCAGSAADGTGPVPVVSGGE